VRHAPKHRRSSQGRHPSSTHRTFRPVPGVRAVIGAVTLALAAGSAMTALANEPVASTAPEAAVGPVREPHGAVIAKEVEQDVSQAREFVITQEAARSRSRTAVAASLAVRTERQVVAERATRDAQRAELARTSPRGLGEVMAAEAGWTGSQWTCLDSLWLRESGWNPAARNASSGAFGIPQALPGGKMASAGADWATNPETQIRWGLGYIRSVYGTPCGAWSHSQGYGWY
jgi:hypothetical protein